MGGCCSCCCPKGDGGASGNSETEMTGKSSRGEARPSIIKINPNMSARTLKLENGGTKVGGTGLALLNLTVEQDAAYWEWHIEDSGGGQGSSFLKFGVARRKDRAFYKKLAELEEPISPEQEGTELMSEIEVMSGDTVGVAVQQVDLPMIQFLLNGEPLHEVAINRFRGSVYPAIYLPNEAETLKLTATLLTEESEFKKMSPHARFGPLIKSRGII